MTIRFDIKSYLIECNFGRCLLVHVISVTRRWIMKKPKIFLNLPKKLPRQDTHQNGCIRKRPKCPNIHLSYFCKKVCHHKLSKIDQSGHTALIILSLLGIRSRWSFILDFLEKSRINGKRGRGWCFFQSFKQCDQIGRFFALWATFSSLWQQLICPNLLHS